MSDHRRHDGSPRPGIARPVATLIAVLFALVGIVANPSTASAHTGFDSSTPAADTTVDTPVEVVTIVFTGEANPVGDRFIALTPAGVLQEAASIETVDDKIFTIRFDPPLAGGEVGLRWNVQAADAHPIEGAFSFTVSASAPTTAPPTTTRTSTAPPLTTATTVAAPATTPVVAAPVTSPPVDAEEAAPVDSSPVDSSPVVASPGPSLDEFLAIDTSKPGETTATVGRLIGFLGVTLGLGAFVFIATTLRGRREEVRHALTAVRVLGVVIAFGAVIEYVGVSRIGGESLIGGWSSAPRFATVLRALGGVGLSVGVAGKISRSRVQQVIRRPSVMRSLSAAVVHDVTAQPLRPLDDAPIVRWTPDARSWPAFAGTVLIIASFWFDGHTVSKGFRPFHALVNSVHVAAGAVWVGGVVTMAAVTWSRHRSGRPMRVVELVVRFSKIASIALASVVAAGALMAFLVLDSFGELTGTPWGKILLLKSAAVAFAMIGGAYNHFRLLPALESDPESPDVLARLRSALTAEAILLTFVVAVTAWLVAAAS